MYAVHLKKESAHEDSIWACAWGKGENPPAQPAADPENGEESQPPAPEPATFGLVDKSIMATGGMDDYVRLWEHTWDFRIKIDAFFLIIRDKGVSG